MLFVPVGQNVIGRAGKFLIRVGKGGIDHRQFMGVRSDRLDILPHGDQAVRGADELVAQPLHHRLHTPVLPQEGMPPPCAEIGDPQVFEAA